MESGTPVSPSLQLLMMLMTSSTVDALAMVGEQVGGDGHDRRSNAELQGKTSRTLFKATWADDETVV